MTDDEVDIGRAAPGFLNCGTGHGCLGRGVGMDVVAANIQEMGGHVGSKIKQGSGARCAMLPLTLAILDGMSVRVAGKFYPAVESR